MAATLFRPKKMADAVQQRTRNIYIIVSSSQILERNLLDTRNRTATTCLVPCLMAGDETARLAHARDAHMYNFFEVHCQSPLLYVMCYVVISF